MMMAETCRPEGVGRIAGATGFRAPENRLLDGRVRVLSEIAERYAELVDPLNGPAGVRGDGGSGPSMPRTYTPTVREFERLVTRLRAEHRELWWHLDGWWLSAESRTARLCPRCGVCHQAEHRHPNKRSGRLSTVKCKQVVIWNRRAGARESLARDAVGVLAGWWALEVEPMLPDEIRVAA